MTYKAFGMTTRRNLLAGAAAVSAAPFLPNRGLASGTSGQINTKEMRERALAFLSGLSDEDKESATFAFDSSRRQRWNFMGPSAKPGLPLERLEKERKLVAMDLLTTALGSSGMRKAENIMILQDVLREMGDGPRDRNRDRFSISFFGDPSPSQLWGWRFEGHHLTLSFTLRGDEIISVTPSSFSSNPNIVNDGQHKGLVALEKEESLARQIYADLSAKNRQTALIQERAFGNILTTAGRESNIGETRQGVPFADLSPTQRDLLIRLSEVYSVDHLKSDLASWQSERLKSGDLMSAHFAWAGSDRPGEMMYYRIHGDTFLIEFASLRNQPLHLHTIRHDLEWNLGKHIV